MGEKTENTKKDISISVGSSSSEPLITRNPSEIVLKVCDLEPKAVCRICYGGESNERLLRPCKCKGTIQYVHRNCLERWLEARNFEACELCHFSFNTRKTRKSCFEWLRQPETQTDRRNFIGDLTCFLFLTPLGIATFWLCAEGAIYYQREKASTLETFALVALAVFLVLAYFTWVLLCTRYHCVMWSRWRAVNWNIHVVDRMPSTVSVVSDQLQNTSKTFMGFKNGVTAGPEGPRLIISDTGVVEPGSSGAKLCSSV